MGLNKFSSFCSNVTAKVSVKFVSTVRPKNFNSTNIRYSSSPSPKCFVV